MNAHQNGIESLVILIFKLLRSFLIITRKFCKIQLNELFWQELAMWDQGMNWKTWWYQIQKWDMSQVLQEFTIWNKIRDCCLLKLLTLLIVRRVYNLLWRIFKSQMWGYIHEVVGQVWKWLIFIGVLMLSEESQWITIQWDTFLE